MKAILKLVVITTGIIVLCSSIFSCNSNRSELKSTQNFDGEISQQQNLEFSFNKDLYPDNKLGEWDSSNYIEFSPAVKGMFKWYSAHVLVFSPANGFMPGTAYTATFTKQLLNHSSKKYTISTEPIRFYTAPLRVEATHVSWTRAQNNANVMVQLDITLNYPINTTSAISKLKLTSSGDPVAITSSNTGTGKQLSVQFMPLNNKDEETPLHITLAGGIAVPGSAYVTDKDTSFSVSVPSRYSLSVSSVTAVHTGESGIITVNTSQPVLEGNLKKCISIEPKVPFDVALNDAGFTITSSALNISQIYQLDISTAIEGAFGGKLKSSVSENISFGKLKPSISFINAKGMYLSGAGFKNLSMNIINVPAVTVTVIKVYENNLEHFMRRDLNYDYHWNDEEEEGSSFEFYDTQDMGDTIFNRTYEAAKLPRQGAAHILHLDFQDRIKDINGVYVLRVKSKDHYWIQQSKILSISDIGLIVKEEKDNIYVFANSLKTATPLSGVKVSFTSTNNQKLYTTTTDGDGLAAFRNISTTAPGFKVGLVTAKKEEEFSFIWFPKTQIGTSRFDVGGRMPNETGLIAMVYGERNLYRPGETIHLSTVVRNEQWATQADVPVKIRLVMPNGKEFAQVRKILNEEGSCEAAFPTPNTALTGTYVAEIYTGNDVLLNTYNISIEEFMPDRLKVSLKTEKEDYTPNESVTATMQVDNLFGTPAAGRNYQCELTLTKGTFSSEKYDDYKFDIAGEVNINADMREEQTGENGEASEAYKLDAVQPEAGLVMGNISATVFDETGRPLHRYAHFRVFTQPVFIGIKCREDYVTSRSPVRVSLLALDKHQQVQANEVEVVLLKRQWHTVIQKNGNGYRYVSQSDDRVITRNKMTVRGLTTNYSFIPQQSGEYLVRVYPNGTGNYVEKRIYAYGWGDTQYTSFEVNNEGNVEIKADKKSYSTGENVKMLFTTPFEGRMLVTLEKDHMIKHYYLNTKDKSASLEFTADEELLPNVYVTAILFRPMDGSDMPLTVAHGFSSVTISKRSNELPVAISVIDKSRSKRKQAITVTTTPGAYVTIAAVDEGILQIKNYTTPDPYGFFYQKTALTVNTYDIYPWLLPEIKSTLSSTGGDGSGMDGSRINPMFVNRVKNVSFWSGILQADGSGKIRYEIDIPQFSGDIRVMAYGYKQKSFGSADAHMKVADPVVISTALPRFLSPKDEVVMPVSLSNTTASAMSADITVVTTGQMEVRGVNTRSVTIPANSDQRAVFTIAALPATGAGKVTVTVKAHNETFVNETDMSIRPPASLQRSTTSGFVAENTTAAIDLKTNFIPATATGKVTIGKSPIVQFTKHLDDLIRYPYGCVEQTTSAAFPQLYYADLVKSMNGTTSSQLNPSYNVQQAINKLQSMQQGDGGLSYWPQGGDVSWWGSIYACHFLLEARKAGFEVNTPTIDRLIDYMKYKLYRKEIVVFFYNGGQKKNIAPQETAYSLYVLALAGQSQQSNMNHYKAHTELLTLESRYMLAAAYSLSGQPSQAREVLPSAFTGEDPDHCFGGSFYSYVRDLSLSLNVLMDIDPNNKQVGIMARQLSEQLKKEKYLNTQENVFSILALGKIARITNQATATATITAGGKTIGTTQGQALSIDVKPYINDAVAIRTNGKGGYYYFREVSGISADGSYKEEDSYMRVRRSFLNPDGTDMGKNFRQNDLVVVHISIEAQNDVSIENVAITDMLPAGFEIENSRLNRMPNLEWMKGQSQPDYRDIRDDRMNMFTTVTRKRKDFYYMVRAVSPGTFQLGPVQADAMYDGNYHSYHGSGVIRITER